MHRVVVTGMAGLCPLGSDWPTVRARLLAGKSAIITKPEWNSIGGLRTRLGAEVPGFERPAHFPRKKVRSMGRVSLLAARATELAIQSAGLGSDQVQSERTGIAYGSTSGSPPALEFFARQLGVERTLDGITGAGFIQMMSHTCAVNLAQFFEMHGRIITTCSACTAGSQGIGYAYESIKFGRQTVMVAGGAEELHLAAAVVFDLLFTTSKMNDQPEKTPRPFDAQRDGLVVGEGAATLILESLEHAQKRGAPILAEIIGFATNCEGSHVVTPSPVGMKGVMRQALKDASLSPDAIDYVNAHATATEAGDIAESHATAECFGRPIPISSLKSYMGHTLGACGAIEAWICIELMREGWMPPTINLERVDPRCAPLDYLTAPREASLDCVMSNNFAFGGINTSLVLKRWTDS
jgi:3-oxoacyl-[acyl-carrier-protein] synthase II